MAGVAIFRNIRMDVEYWSRNTVTCERRIMEQIELALVTVNIFAVEIVLLSLYK